MLLLFNSRAAKSTNTVLIFFGDRPVSLATFAKGCYGLCGGVTRQAVSQPPSSCNSEERLKGGRSTARADVALQLQANCYARASDWNVRYFSLLETMLSKEDRESSTTQAARRR
jgi:hypothetical protein